MFSHSDGVVTISDEQNNIIPHIYILRVKSSKFRGNLEKLEVQLSADALV